MTVLWTEDGIASLTQIAAYLEQFSTDNASRTLVRLADRLELVDQMPFQGRIVPEFELREVREVILRPYRIWYHVVSGGIEVLAIFHGARDTR